MAPRQHLKHNCIKQNELQLFHARFQNSVPSIKVKKRGGDAAADAHVFNMGLLSPMLATRSLHKQCSSSLQIISGHLPHGNLHLEWGTYWHTVQPVMLFTFAINISYRWTRASSAGKVICAYKCEEGFFLMLLHDFWAAWGPSWVGCGGVPGVFR